MLLLVSAYGNSCTSAPQAGCIEESGVLQTDYGPRLRSQKVRDDRKDYEAVKKDYFAKSRRAAG